MATRDSEEEQSPKSFWDKVEHSRLTSWKAMTVYLVAIVVFGALFVFWLFMRLLNDGLGPF